MSIFIKSILLHNFEKNSLLFFKMNQKEVQFFQSLGIEFLGFIGRGAYGEVFLAHSTKYKCNFVLKKVPCDCFNETEIECLKRLDDIHIVNLYDYYKFEGNIYMLLEYCPNDLDRLMKDVKSLPHDILVKYCHQVLLSVKACHDQKIAHSDIKPSNFLLDKYGHVKITDFGLSTIFTKDPSSTTFKGTRAFMAPEMVKDRTFNPMAADIWAVGVTLYYLATFSLPFFSLDLSKLTESILRGVYADSIIDDSLLRQLIARCLEIDPNERATVDELLNSRFFKEVQPIKLNESNIILNRLDSCTRSHQIVHPKLKIKPLRGSSPSHLIAIAHKLGKPRLILSRTPEPR